MCGRNKTKLEISKRDTQILKGVAILFMLLLHLFARKEVNGLYVFYPTINEVPLIYYLAIFGDACVPIFLFLSGYGLYINHEMEQVSNKRKNFIRIFKLLINFWIIIILFVSIGFLTASTDSFPGSIGEFLLNFFVISSSYNGAWWFLQTYIILVLFSPLLIKVIRKYNSIGLISLFGAIYLLSYVQRIKHIIEIDDSLFFNVLSNAIELVGTSLLPFIIGLIFRKEKIYSKISNRFYHLIFKNIYCIIGIFILIIIHAFYESMVIAPFTAILFICFFNLMDKNMLFQNTLIFIGKHSTNIWLTHMFFYKTIFPELTFSPRYPVLIFLWLILLCLVTSSVINIIYKPIIRWIDKIDSNDRKNYIQSVVNKKTS